MAEASTWGVSVDDVSALAPHIAIASTEAVPPGTPDPFNQSTVRKVTNGQVAAFIQDISAMVDLRLHSRHRVTDAAFAAKVDTAAADIVTNGAGSYLVAAAFPIKAGVSENTNYSAELWRRYTEGLAALEKALADFIKAGDGVTPTPGAAGRVSGYFPPILFRDDMRF
ncbi:hypothetical protein HYP71_gp014 [Arthrobacter phage KBurrousTX]|uniref:Uncharacterized protein n=1 Tax=Arthrobacter phage KBurrousTX TaxID=2315608 RepID=A0A386K844_9CAUD|nr:hypothetical protein HYP71_gp014 [Arthrobacter phage KBurrousTX]AYD81508.1 hypothetical protein KBurrousTX_14 [Arthrobacter phage KBurrousTX]